MLFLTTQEKLLSDPRIAKAAFGSGPWNDLQGVETDSTQKQEEKIARGLEEMRRRKEEGEAKRLEPKVLFPATDKTPGGSGEGRSREEAKKDQLGKTMFTPGVYKMPNGLPMLMVKYDPLLTMAEIDKLTSDIKKLVSK